MITLLLATGYNDLGVAIRAPPAKCYPVVEAQLVKGVIASRHDLDHVPIVEIRQADCALVEFEEDWLLQVWDLELLLFLGDTLQR